MKPITLVVTLIAILVAALGAAALIAVEMFPRTREAPPLPPIDLQRQPMPLAEAKAQCFDKAAPFVVREESSEADRVVRACSDAIQSRALSPADLAQARLVRGDARTALGDHVLASGDYLEAQKRYQAVMDPNNPDALQLFRNGAALEGLGKTDAALDKYDEAIRADPKLALAYFGRGILLATRQRAYVRAIGDFDKVIALEPRNSHAFIKRGDAYSQLGEIGRAFADLNHAVELDPDHAAPYVARGIANDRRGDTAAAMADYTAALKICPKCSDALENRGILETKLGQYDRAIADLTAVIAQSPHRARAFFNRGYALFLKKEYELAGIDFGTAIYFDPDLGPAYLARCLTQAMQGKELVHALDDCDRALKLMPANRSMRETRGFIYLRLGDPVIAASEFQEALRLEPNRALSLYALGVAKERAGRTDGAGDKAAALALDPRIAKEFTEYAGG